MNRSDFLGKKVALLGAGIENIALIPFLREAGADITLCDRIKTDTTATLIGQGVKVVTGDDYLSGLDQYDYIFRIAGLPVATLQEALKHASSQPIISSPTDLFIALAPCHIVGVTGTKGKGTTATMIGSILAEAGHRVKVVGNIGKPIFAIFDEITPDDYAVIELSSFQLEDIQHSPEVAVLLPISQEHLQPLSEINPNYHKSVEAYQAAKANITARQTPDNFLAYAYDSLPSRQIAAKSSARKVGVSEKQASEADLTVDQTGLLSANGQSLLELSELGLKGSHIFLNASIAVATCREIGCDVTSIKEGLRKFKPLPHRLERFATIDDIEFVDDSYATSPDATIAALSAFDNPIILLLGGSSKGADFRELAVRVATSPVKAVVLLGHEADHIEESLDQYAPNLKVIRRAKDIEDAVSQARELASPGDVVLLSPACASKDMFTDAADRGDKFQQAVNAK